MAKDFYHVSNYGDSLTPGENLKIEHRIYAERDSADLSRLVSLPTETLQTMRGESAAAEQAIFEKVQSAAREWDAQAGQTLGLDMAIEYARTPPVKHSSNQWGIDSVNDHYQSVSNMVYKMSYYVYEDTRYDRDAQKSVPVAWQLTWSVRLNTSDGRRGVKIAGQDRKRYTDKADMEKYLAGRIKAHSHLFTEISPPIPKEHSPYFRVNGQLLPGYTVEGEEPKPQQSLQSDIPEPAADIGGDIISPQQNIEQRKERENMNEPINIQLANRDQYSTREAGTVEGAWLKLPATTEQLTAALARIGAQGGEQNRDYCINGIETPLAAFEKIPLENIQKAGIDELNYLAARLETIEPVQLAKLNAAVAVMSDSNDIHRLIEFTHNTDFFVHNPDVFNHKHLGENCLYESGLVQMPEEWRGAVDLEKLGEIAAIHEKGVFTEHGYIVPYGEEWKPLTEIPLEYQIAPKTEKPDIEQDTISTRTATTVTAKPPEQSKPAIAAAPFVLVSDNPRDKLKEITEKLESGIKGIFDSEQYKTYLNTLSKFHNYSFNNCLLIAMQNPAATHVAGFNAWRDDFKRPVMKGEKGIKILAPSPFKTKKMVDAVDTNGKPVFDGNGRRKKEEQEIIVPAFKVTTVFDVSQTDGEPLPQLGVSELTGSVDKYKDFFAALEKTSHVPIAFENITSGAKGYYSQTDKRIAINEGMSELQNLKTAIHEITHARLHDIDKNAPKDITRPDSSTREVQAESIAYTVCQHYGLDTSDYSFGYVATWSGDKQLDTLKNSLDVIRKEAGAIITEIDKHFAEISQDREQTAERQPGYETWSEPATTANAPDNPGMPSDDVNAYLPKQDAPEQGGTFAIYQLKDGGETRNLRNETLAAVTAAGLAVALTNYDNVYAAPLEKGMTLDDIYFNFNMAHPEDFKGHSLSVSDVVVMNRDGKETAFYVDNAGFKELPDFLTPKEQTAEKPAPTVDLKIVADYMQKQYDAVQAADPDKAQGQAAFNAAINRLERANERIPDEHPQLKALLSHAAQSPDLQTLKERMQTMNTDFIQHYSTAVQNTVDMSGKAEQPAQKSAPAAVKQTEKASTTPAPKTPAQGENVAEIEARVKAGETINLSDLSDAIKKDKAAAQTAPTTGKTQTRTNTRGKGANTPAAKTEQPSIKEQIAAGKQQLAAQKPAPAKAAAQNKNAGLGD